MVYPALTAIYAAILALIYVALTIWVIAGRFTEEMLFGDGNSMLMKSVRSHGNFAEYVPFAVVLMAFLEAGGAPSTLVHVLLIILVIARLLHPLGMIASKNSIQQFACRGGGILATAGVILVAAVDLLLRQGLS